MRKENGEHELIHGLYSFLTEVNRVADINYIPSDDDVIRARLRTVGVQEHHVTLETGPEAGREWLIYDVGGSRSMVSVILGDPANA